MFGGLSFMYRGRMCCGIVGADLIVRVAAVEFDSVMRRRHVRPMDFTGKPLKGFVYVSPRAPAPRQRYEGGWNVASDSVITGSRDKRTAGDRPGGKLWMDNVRRQSK
jgi:hypothetical protein